MFQAKFVLKIETHILYSITFFENRAFYEILWINIVEPGRPHDDMAYARCILDA